MRADSRGAVALLALVSATLATARATPTAAQEPLAPRFVDVWFGGPLDSIYNAEYERLSAACSDRGDACWVEGLDTTAVRLAPLWAEPDAAEPVGWLAARLRTEDRWPHAALVVRSADDEEVTIRDDLGDWGYGTTLALRAVHDDWLQPWLLGPAGGHWLRRGATSPGFGVVEGPYGLEGRLWRLGPVPATAAEEAAAPGARARGGVELPRAVYFVLAVEDGTVRLRPKSRTDMECGAPAETVVAAPPAYVLPLAELLDAQGRPRVEVAYPRGC